MTNNEDPLKVSIRTRDESKGEDAGKVDTYYGDSANSKGNVNDPNHGHMIQKSDGTIIYLRPQGGEGTKPIVDTGEGFQSAGM